MTHNKVDSMDRNASGQEYTRLKDDHTAKVGSNATVVG